MTDKPSQHLHIIRLRAGALEWLQPGEASPVSLSDEAARSRLQGVLAERRQTVLFAAPGEAVRVQPLEVAPEEKRHLRTALPFLLEESLAADVETLHFAASPAGGEGLCVQICERAAMQEWQAALADFDGLKAWLAEPLLLPWAQGEWCLVLEGERALLRWSEAGATALERDLLPALLTALLAEHGTPERLIVYGDPENEVSELLPESLQAAMQWRRGGLASALWLAGGKRRWPDLRQGEFAARLPLERWWRQWRVPAVVLVAAVLLQPLAAWTDYRRLNAENLALREAVQASYREAFPRGAVVDAERQLRRQLNLLQGTAGSSGFVSLMEQVGAVLAEQADYEIATVNYNQRAADLRLTLLAPDFEAVERIRAGLVSAGLDAEMESSAASGDAVRARLRIEGGA